MKIKQSVKETIIKGADNNGITKEEAIELLNIKLHSKEFYELLYTANELSRKTFNNKGENHLHIGLNASPCPFNCEFCSLSDKHGLFKEDYEFSWEQLLDWTKQAEEQNSDAINLMTTGTYKFEKLLEIGKSLSKKTSVPLVANTRDISHKEAEDLLDSGYVGMYHAIRLGEGVDTPFNINRRIETIKTLNDVGLKWMNCIEPVGPEHSYDEIASLMILAREHKATYSGAMRRVNFPGSPYEKYGMITEFELAKIVAVSRLVMGDVPKAHCTHEPNSISLAAGANLFFPEVGSSPRDLEADSSKGIGKDISLTNEMFKEMNWDTSLPSNCF